MVTLLLVVLLPLAQFDNSEAGYGMELWMLDPRVTSEDELNTALATIASTTNHARSSAFDSVGAVGDVYFNFTVNSLPFVFRSGDTIYGDIVIPTQVPTPVVPVFPTPVPTRVIKAESTPMPGAVNIKAASNIIVTKNGDDIEIAALTGGTPIAQPTLVLEATAPVVVSAITGGYEIHLQTPTSTDTPTSTSTPTNTPTPSNTIVPTPQEISANGGDLYQGKPFDFVGSGSVIISATDVGPRIEVTINSSTGGTPAPTPDNGVYARADDLTQVKSGTLRFVEGTGISIDFNSIANPSTGDYHVNIAINTPTSTPTPTSTVATSTPTKLAIRDLRDVNPAMTPTLDQVLTWDGSRWTSAGITHPTQVPTPFVPTPVNTRVIQIESENHAGTLNLLAGSNITFTTSGNDLTVDAAAGADDDFWSKGTLPNHSANSSDISGATVGFQHNAWFDTDPMLFVAKDRLHVWLDADHDTDDGGWGFYVAEEDANGLFDANTSDNDAILFGIPAASERRLYAFTNFEVIQPYVTGGGSTEAAYITNSHDSKRVLWTSSTTSSRTVNTKADIVSFYNTSDVELMQVDADSVRVLNGPLEAQDMLAIPEATPTGDPPSGMVYIYHNISSGTKTIRINDSSGNMWDVALTFAGVAP